MTEGHHIKDYMVGSGTGHLLSLVKEYGLGH